jgi:putative Mg2+ transporter-C (MgtC) family protein
VLVWWRGRVPSDWDLVARVAVGFVLAFAIGFERELRGSPAGDRTFGLIGASIAGMTAVLWREAPQAVAGAITGLGFIGAGVVLHGENQFVRGVTTAAAIFATAAMTVVAGTGHLLLATLMTGLILLALELRDLPVLRFADARRYQPRFRNDEDPPTPSRRRARPPS